MTREEIEQLPAGPELNKAIAQLLGYTVYHYDKDVEENCYFMLMDSEFDPVVGCMMHDGERKTEEEAWNDAPDFSTDIAAAWQVAEHFHRLRFHVDTHTVGLAWWAALIVEPDNGGSVMDPWPKRYEAAGETAPLSLCRAALLTTLTI